VQENQLKNLVSKPKTVKKEKSVSELYQKVKKEKEGLASLGL